MGGRGASLGVSRSGKTYGTEYTTLHQSGNIKFVKYNNPNLTRSPMETMTSGRIYATIDRNNHVRYINYFDKNNKRFKQIDVAGMPHEVDGESIIPHTHKGYEHDEKGTKAPSSKERKMIDRILKTWKNRENKE